MKASIIIRTRNEERWITACLDTVFQQDYEDFEVVIVDNCSEDGTLSKIEYYDIKLVTIGEFRPGLAINQGIRASTGDLIVCLSGHCIPVNDRWLANLVRPLAKEEVAGVYGRQQPMSFSSDRDKRDLLTVFGLDPKVQRKDPFFHNANSAIRRDTWNAYPFDQDTRHIEDRLWAKQVLVAGMEIRYQPEASVYHFHGIHQDDDPHRRRRIVRILESLAAGETDVSDGESLHPIAPKPEDLFVVALVPTRGSPMEFAGKPLIAYTIDKARSSKFVDKIVVLTDNELTAELARKEGACVPFLRPKELSKDFVTVSDILKFGIDELQNWDIYPDVCVVLEETYPLRPEGLVDELIVQLLREGIDSVLAMRPEQRSIWIERAGQLETLSPLIPRKLKTEMYLVSLFGLGFATYPQHIRDGSMGLERSQPYCVENEVAAIEVRNNAQCEEIGRLLQQWRTISKQSD